MAEAAWRTNVLNVLERSEKQLQLIASLLEQPTPTPVPPFFGQTRLNAPTPVSVTTEPSFSFADGTPARALIDGDRHVQADILTMPPVSVSVEEKGFADVNNVPTRALVDSDRHVQCDMLSTVNPPNLDVALSTRASEATLNALKNALSSVGTDKVRVSIIDSLPAGTNKIGSVDVATLPSLPSGTNKIGSVDVASLPSLPAGTNKIGGVDAYKAGTWNIDNLLNPHPVKFTPEEKMLDANQFTGTYAPTAAGSTTIISAVSGKVIRVYDFYLWNSGTADVGVRLYFGTSGKNVFKGKLSAKTGVVKSFIRPWESNADDSLVLYLDAAGTVDYGVGAVQA